MVELWNLRASLVDCLRDRKTPRDAIPIRAVRERFGYQHSLLARLIRSGTLPAGYGPRGSVLISLRACESYRRRRPTKGLPISGDAPPVDGEPSKNLAREFG